MGREKSTSWLVKNVKKKKIGAFHVQNKLLDLKQPWLRMRRKCAGGGEAKSKREIRITERSGRILSTETVRIQKRKLRVRH